MLLLKPYGTAQYGRTPSSYEITYVTFINTVATYTSCREKSKNIRDDLWTLLFGRNVVTLKSLCGGGVPSSHPSLGLSVFFLSFLVVTSAAFMYRMQAGNGVGPRAK